MHMTYHCLPKKLQEIDKKPSRTSGVEQGQNIQDKHTNQLQDVS